MSMSLNILKVLLSEFNKILLKFRAVCCYKVDIFTLLSHHLRYNLFQTHPYSLTLMKSAHYANRLSNMNESIKQQEF